MKLKIIIALLFLNPLIFAVGEVGAVFLLISPSPLINGYGGSGAGALTYDAYSTYYNPAHSLLYPGVSLQYSSMHTPWLPNLADDIYLSYQVKSFGYDGISLGEKARFQFQLSELNTYIDLGEQMAMDEFGNQLGSYNSYMKAKSSTLSVGLQSNKHPILLTLGFTRKEAKQTIETYSSVDNLHDWGFRFIVDNLSISPSNSFLLSYGLGYSKSNIGDLIYFIDSAQGDLAPMTARLGMTFGVKINILNNYGIEVKSIREAQDLLVERVLVGDELYNTFYKKDFLGDIDIDKHIFKGRSDDTVIIHNGTEITLLNFYSIRTGNLINIDGHIDLNTEGYSIDFGNFFYLLTRFNNKIFKALNIKYNYSKDIGEEGCPRCNTSYSNVQVSFYNIDKIINKSYYNSIEPRNDGLLSVIDLKSNNEIVMGINYSTWDGRDINSSYTEYLPGMRMGIQNRSKDNILGLSFSQKGVKLINDSSSYYKWKLNYISLHTYLPVNINSRLNLLLGTDLSLLYSATSNYCSDNS